SAGKSVLVYTESATHFIDIEITETTFNASEVVAGKAAIEIDTSLSAGADITIDAATTATGFDAGSVSGSTLYNNKKGREGANNDVTVTVAGETVLKVVKAAEINGLYYTSIHAALEAAKANDTIKLIEDVTLDSVLELNKDITLDGNGKTITAAIKVTANVNIENADIIGVAGNKAVITITANINLVVKDSKITALTAQSARSGAAASSESQYVLLAEGVSSATAYIDAELVYGDKNIFSGDANKITASFREAYKADLAARGFVTKAAENGMVTITGNVPYYIGENGNWFFNGEDTGHKAIATDGVSPEIREVDGVKYWFIGEVNTGVKAEAVNGATPEIGANGNWWINGEDTGKPARGENGQTPYVGENGNWFIGTTDTGVNATAVIPHIGTNGNWFIGTTDTGVPATGKDGETPYIGTNGNWWIGTTDLGVSAAGKNGEDGKTPHIGTNGNWWIGDTDLGISAEGKDGETPTFKIENGHLYAKFPSDTDWRDLGVVAGSDGTDGKTPTIKVENGELFVSYDDGATWSSLGNIAGTDGINGKTPTFKIENGELKVSYDEGASWTGLGNIAGADGTDGKTPTIKVENGGLFVSYDDGASWTSLGNIAGTDGINGKTPTFKVENGELKVSYEEGASWTGLGNIAGADGVDGTTPHIGENGNWFIGETDTGVPAKAQNGITPHIGENGNWFIGTTDTGVLAKAQNGTTPHIGENGNWFIGETDTGVLARGQDGKTPSFKIEDGHLHVSFDNVNWTDLGNVTGEDGKTPYIGENGNWWIGNDDLGIKAKGEDGAAGVTPHIGENGNWFIGETDTGISAVGQNNGGSADMGDMKEIIVLCVIMGILCVVTMLVAVITRRSRYRWWIVS
ncbi:MAG: hypothetical protein IJX58_08085, partial [Clostridia bacterium]|nr:hypothetical protein [Clostridia bacterium]